MKLLCDIGNTFTTVAKISLSNKVKIEKFPTKKFYRFVKQFHNIPMYISCVVTEIEQKFVNNPFMKFVTYKDLEKKFKIKYDTKNIGVDRLLNIFAVKQFVGGDTVVVSAGTAVTIDYLNKNGEYVGGEIFIGIGSAVQSLAQRTSKLPNISYTKLQRFKYEKVIEDKDLIGSDTFDCIMKGMINFYSSGINNILSIIKPRNIVITGGDAKIVIKLLRKICNKKIWMIENLVILGLGYLTMNDKFITEEEWLKIFHYFKNKIICV